MKLIGQYDSPFVRRVGITLTLYGIAFEHLPWSTFGDADKIAPYNPLRRVPVLVFDDGISVMDMFRCPTVSLLARHLSGEQAPATQQTQTRASTRKNFVKRQRQQRAHSRAATGTRE